MISHNFSILKRSFKMNLYKTILLCSAVGFIVGNAHSMIFDSMQNSSDNVGGSEGKKKNNKESAEDKKHDQKTDDVKKELSPQAVMMNDLKEKISKDKEKLEYYSFEDKAPDLDAVKNEFKNKKDEFKARVSKWKTRYLNYQNIFAKSKREELAKVMVDLESISKFEQRESELYNVGFYINQCIRLYKEASKSKVPVNVVDHLLLTVMPNIARNQVKELKEPLKEKINNVEYFVEKLPIENYKELSVESELQRKLSLAMEEEEKKLLNSNGGIIIQGIYDPKVDSLGKKVDRYKFIAATLEISDKKVIVKSADYIKLTPASAPFETSEKEDILEAAKKLDEKINPVPVNLEKVTLYPYEKSENYSNHVKPEISTTDAGRQENRRNVKPHQYLDYNNPDIQENAGKKFHQEGSLNDNFSSNNHHPNNSLSRNYNQQNND